MQANFYLRAFNKKEAEEKAHLRKRELNSFVDLTVDTEDGEIVLKHDGKFIIKCKDYKVGKLFSYPKWEEAINISEFKSDGSIHLMIAVNPGFMLEYQKL